LSLTATRAARDRSRRSAAESFLSAQRELIRGDVLEYGSADKTISLHTGARSLTLAGERIVELGEAMYDCVILDISVEPDARLLRAAHRALRPGGAMLAAAAVGVAEAQLRAMLEHEFAEDMVEAFDGAETVGIRALKSASATAPPPRPEEIQGQVDQATCRLVTGWAWDSGAPDQHLRLELWSGQRLLGEAWGREFRRDLAAAGKGGGAVAFSFLLDPPLHGVPLPELVVIPAGGDRPLRGSPTRAVCRCSDRSGSTLRLAGCAIEQPGPGDPLPFPWLTVSGWAVGGEAPVKSVELSHRGTVFRAVAASSARPALAAGFPGLPWATSSGFDVAVNLLATGRNTEIDIEAILWNGERARVGRIDGNPAAPERLPVAILLSPAGAAGPIPALGQDTAVQAVVAVRPGAAVGHPGIASAHGWNVSLDDARALVWCSDGAEHLTPRFLRAATGALERTPMASFAVASERSPRSRRELPAVLSGSALGAAILVRASAIHSAGGLDEAAESAAFAQWDIAIRLAEAGHTWVEVPEAAADAIPLRERLGGDAAGVLYRKHAALYRRHLREVLFELEADVAPRTAAVTELARTIEHSLAPRVRARRRERDRLARRSREADAGAAGPPRYWGDFRRLDPFGPFGGAERGLPLDRLYTERFLYHNACDIRGAVLEYGHRRDAALFGGDRVARCDVVGRADPPPDGGYDCILMLGALRFAADPAALIADCRRALAPGGVLLASAPCAAAIDREDPDSDRWRFSAASLRRLLSTAFAASSIAVVAAGNRRTALAQLSGLSADELEPEILALHNPNAPLLVAARAVAP
jgi:SAM-dependent methyltransferase